MTCIVPKCNSIMNIRATYNGDVFRQLDEIFFYTNAGMRCVQHILIITFQQPQAHRRIKRLIKHIRIARNTSLLH